jgi:hypothetical protein
MRKKIEYHICPDCSEKQWSIADRKYLEIYETCWACDKKRWKAGKLSLEEFEEREKQSVKSYGNIF